MKEVIKYFVTMIDAAKYIERIERYGYKEKHRELLSAGNVRKKYEAQAHERGCDIIVLIRDGSQFDLRITYYNSDLDDWPHPHYVEE